MKFILTLEQYETLRTALCNAKVSLQYRNEELKARNIPTDVNEASLASVMRAMNEINMGKLPIAH